MRSKFRLCHYSQEELEGEEQSEPEDDKLLIEKLDEQDKLPTEVSDVAALASRREELKNEIEESMDNEDTGLDDAETDADQEDDIEGVEDSLETEESDEEQSDESEEDKSPEEKRKIQGEDTDKVVANESLSITQVNKPLRSMYNSYLNTMSCHMSRSRAQKYFLNFEEISPTYTKEALIESLGSLKKSIESLVSAFEVKTKKSFETAEKISEEIGVLQGLFTAGNLVVNESVMLDSSKKRSLSSFLVSGKLDINQASTELTEMLGSVFSMINELAKVEPSKIKSTLLNRFSFKETDNQVLASSKEYPGNMRICVKVDLPLDSLVVDKDLNEVFLLKNVNPSDVDNIPTKCRLEKTEYEGLLEVVNRFCDKIAKSSDTSKYIYPLVTSITDDINNLNEELLPVRGPWKNPEKIYERVKNCFERYIQVLILTGLYLKITDHLQLAASAAKMYIENHTEKT